VAKEEIDVVVAAYQGLDVARADFDSLVGLVKSKAVRVEGVILVTHELDGTVTVADTGDRVGRKGAGWGEGVGLAVGLFAPPLLAAVAVGAAGGAIVGEFADHQLKSGIRDKIGTALPAGSAGVIAVLPHDELLAYQQALPGAMAKSVVASDKDGLVRGLKSSLEEAMGKFSPDRTRLPIPDPAFGGVMGRTLEASSADWSIDMTPTAPDGAPSVLLVLIDDSGFGNPGTFGGPVSTPTMTRVGEMGLSYNRFHVTAMCSPTRAATLTGRNNHAVGFGSVGKFPGPVPDTIADEILPGHGPAMGVSFGPSS
jgi:arylsulfatase